MNKFPGFIALLFLAFAPIFASVSHAGGEQPPSALVQYTLQSSIMMRGWETKSYGEQKPHDVVTVITTQDLNADIVILRWNADRSRFQTELYHLEERVSWGKSWVSGISEVDKSIVQQPGGQLHVFELVSGPGGGQKVEVIKLDHQP